MIVQPGYEKLHSVLMRALNQAATGKGHERHANDDPFHEQIMCYMAGQLGIAAPVFQVVKKSVEACRLPYPANVNELLGAINYAAGAVIELERQQVALAGEAKRTNCHPVGFAESPDKKAIVEALEKEKARQVEQEKKDAIEKLKKAIAEETGKKARIKPFEFTPPKMWPPGPSTCEPVMLNETSATPPPAGSIAERILQ
jgi:hypothetical protein